MPRDWLKNFEPNCRSGRSKSKTKWDFSTHVFHDYRKLHLQLFSISGDFLKTSIVKFLEYLALFISFQLLSSFKTWRQRFQRNTRNMDILEEHLLKKDAELLQRCLVRWMKFMLRCKAEKSYQKKLVAKVKSPQKLDGREF